MTADMTREAAPSEILLSVVVPTRNRRNVLARLLASIAPQEGTTIEVLLIDDASADPVNLEQARQNIPVGRTLPVKLTRCAMPVGACAARNIGIAQASGKYILFLDDDTELVGSDLCSRLVAFADKNPTVGVIALAELTPTGAWGFNFGPPGPPTEVARFHGCGALFRSQCLVEVGGFFEPLNYYYEEFEISMRVINAGWRIVYDPSMLIVHHRDPRGRNTRSIDRLISRNAFITLLARFPFWMIPPALVSQAVRFLKTSWSRHDRWGLPIVVYQVLKALPRVLPVRRTVTARALRRYKNLAQHPTVWSV